MWISKKKLEQKIEDVTFDVQTEHMKSDFVNRREQAQWNRIEKLEKQIKKLQKQIKEGY